MDFWNDKDDEYKFKMVDVYREQIQDLNVILPTFKVANTTIHFDESAPRAYKFAIPLFLYKTKEMPSSIAPLSNYMTSAEL